MSYVVIFIAAFCVTFPAAHGAGLEDALAVISETTLARILDSYITPPPRQTGFETLVPNANIRIHCAQPSVPYFQEVLLNDIHNFNKKINYSLPLAIFIHGWRNHSNETLFGNLTSNFRQFVGDSNYCLLDWSPYAAFGYQIAARQSVPLVAQYLFSFLQTISIFYYPLGSVSLIGFSMGAQIAGLTGKLLPGRLGAIFALDPAGPLFSHPMDVGPTRRLDSTDAPYVQVLYTSRYTVGFGPIVGTQNFLSNKGYHPQPTCNVINVPPLDPVAALGDALRCSHQYAVRLFTATLNPLNLVYGQKCKSILGSLLCTPLLLPKDRVGYYAQRMSGNFYL